MLHAPLPDGLQLRIIGLCQDICLLKKLDKTAFDNPCYHDVSLLRFCVNTSCGHELEHRSQKSGTGTTGLCSPRVADAFDALPRQAQGVYEERLSSLTTLLDLLSGMNADQKQQQAKKRLRNHCVHALQAFKHALTRLIRLSVARRIWCRP